MRFAYKSEEERKEGRRLTLLKYNRSKKRKLCSKRYREAHPQRVYEWSRAWANEHKERIKYLRKRSYSTPEGKAKRDASTKRYCEKNRIKRLAKDSIHNAIKAGKMTRPNECSMCKEITKIEGHHPDYKKPLQVIWVCDKCHTKIHYGDK